MARPDPIDRRHDVGFGYADHGRTRSFGEISAALGLGVTHIGLIWDSALLLGRRSAADVATSPGNIP